MEPERTPGLPAQWTHEAAHDGRTRLGYLPGYAHKGQQGSI